VREESGVIHMQDMLVQVEMVIVDAPLSSDDAHVEEEDARGFNPCVPEGRGIYLDLVMHNPGPIEHRDQNLS
jgi:hypothetical protein